LIITGSANPIVTISKKAKKKLAPATTSTSHGYGQTGSLSILAEIFFSGLLIYSSNRLNVK